MKWLALHIKTYFLLILNFLRNIKKKKTSTSFSVLFLPTFLVLQSECSWEIPRMGKGRKLTQHLRTHCSHFPNHLKLINQEAKLQKADNWNPIKRSKRIRKRRREIAGAMPIAMSDRAYGEVQCISSRDPMEIQNESLKWRK